jgi:hypothetical protein
LVLAINNLVVLSPDNAIPQIGRLSVLRVDVDH